MRGTFRSPSSTLPRALPWWEILALYLRQGDCSLDAEVDGNPGKSWDEHLASDDPQPDSVFARAESDASVRAMVDSLTPRLAVIIRKRFGFDDGEPMTLEQIGAALNLSRERIRQLEREALTNLRKLFSVRAAA